jgi:hypothetical protein
MQTQVIISSHLSKSPIIMPRSTRKNNYADPPPPAKCQTRASSKKDHHDLVALNPSAQPAVAAAVGVTGQDYDQTKDDKAPVDESNTPDVNQSIVSSAAGQRNNEVDDDDDDNASIPIASIVNEEPPP